MSNKTKLCLMIISMVLLIISLAIVLATDNIFACIAIMFAAFSLTKPIGHLIADMGAEARKEADSEKD